MASWNKIIGTSLALIVLASLIGLVAGMLVGLIIPAEFSTWTFLIYGVIGAAILVWVGKKGIWRGFEGLSMLMSFFVLLLVSAIISAGIGMVNPDVAAAVISFNSAIDTYGGFIVLTIWYVALLSLANMLFLKIKKAM